MAITGKIRQKVRSARFVNVILAVCFLAAQLVPTAFAAAAVLDDSDYMIICTADGFKKIPFAELGLQDLANGDTQSDLPAQEECALCNLVCAKGLSDAAPHGAVVWLPREPVHQVLQDDRPVDSGQSAFHQDISPRAPPTFV